MTVLLRSVCSTITFLSWSSIALAQTEPSATPVDTAAPEEEASPASEVEGQAEADAPETTAEETENPSNEIDGEASDPTAASSAEEPPTASEPEPDPVADVTEEAEPQTTYSSDDTFAQVAEPNAPETYRPPTPFDQGRIRLGLGLGWASAGTQDWLILGAGAGYYVVNGLELGADTTFWVIGKPFIATITPGVRYVLHMVPVVKPYVGAFYRHYFVADSYRDTDSLGARGGVYFMTGRMSYFGGGVVYEHFLDQDLFLDQDQVYPEITFALAF